MPNYENNVVQSTLNVAPIKGRVDAAYRDSFYEPSVRLAVDSPASHAPPYPVSTDYSDTGQAPGIVSNNYENNFRQEAMGIDWWEHFHVIPREVILGNVLSNQQIAFEVYSAFRREFHDWTDFINNAGAGVEMLNLPPFPYTFGPQSSGGLNLILNVSTSGDPKVDDTLDFVFDVPATISIPIELDRIVLFELPPEMPYVETLEFLTDVLGHKDGTEQRIALRKNPRQLFTWNFILEDGLERTRVHNFLFDWQHRIFGVPQWHELTRLTAAASIDDFTVTVQTTDYADYRTDEAKGNLVLIYAEDGSFYDVLPLNSLTTTTLTFESGLLNDYPVGAIVCPLRTGVLTDSLTGSRFPTADARLRLDFRVLDNDGDLGDVSAWPAFNSKVLLDDCNVVRGTFGEKFERRINVIDGQTGATEQESPWPVNRRVSRKTFRAVGKQGVWDVRQLLHALKGQQVSWYLPSFSEDLIPDSTLNSGSNQLNIVHVGYTRFVQSRNGRNIIRITFNNGDPPLVRTVTGSTESSPTSEQLVLDDTWPSSYTVDDVDRIEFVEKVRFDTDRIQIRHEVGDRIAIITAPVTAVLE